MQDDVKMLTGRACPGAKNGRFAKGFTIMEAMLAVVFLGLMAAGVANVHFSGIQSMDVRETGMLLDSHLRSRMELLLATPFDKVTGGSEPVNVNGTSYTINWTVTGADLDGDTNPEPTAKQITVSVDSGTSRAVTSIMVDNESKVKRL
jgi:Tfp pilus assembly protein PilV